MSRKQDLMLEGIRRLVGGQWDLESAVSRRPTTNTTVATRLPINPISRPIRTVADFHAINARLADTEVRSQLVTYLACLGGRSLEDFTKRVYYALFVDDISLHINFKGRKIKEGLSDSQTYGVIKEVFGIWNGDGKATLADLEVAVTKRLKRSLDNLTKKGKKNVNDTQASGVEADDARGAVQLALGRKDTSGRSRQSSTDKGIGRRCSPLYGEASVLQTVGSHLQAFAT
ncbi:hypothetical protein SprV_0200564500 [Sparganum proliferum]